VGQMLVDTHSYIRLFMRNSNFRKWPIALFRIAKNQAW
jgi:hypothetical protein